MRDILERVTAHVDDHLPLYAVACAVWTAVWVLCTWAWAYSWFTWL
jgi:hypothetical protein